MSRLKIALVAHGIHFRGGMERCFAELTDALCLAHDIHLFTSEAADVPFENVTMHHIPVVRRPLLAKFAQFYVCSSHRLRREEFDIIHTIGGITARQNIVSAQYCQAAWGNAIRQTAGAAEGITAYHRWMWRFTGYFEKRAVNSQETLRVIANSRRTGEDLEKFYGTDTGKIEVVYNAVDPIRFSPANQAYRASIRQRYGICEKALLLLFVGEYRRKGLATVIRALGKLHSSQVHLLAVGQGDQEKYASLAAQNGIRSQVTFAAPVSDIERIFGAADVFVFPTLYEPFGMVITEAMASGLPVITSRTAGAAELIEEGVSGLLLDCPGDPDELATALNCVASDAALRREMGIKARQRVCHYDWKCAADQTQALYRQVTHLKSLVATQ
jgi:UDP-glucose:(heptosyl)LPS alpha-1,3-glucosyltransferase